MTKTEVEMIRLWRLDCHTRGLAEGTIKEYERFLLEYRRDAGPLLGSGTQQLSLFMLERSDRWCPSTRMVVRRAFRSFYAFAFEVEQIETNPALGLKAIKVPVTQVRTPGKAERLALVAACESERDRTIIDLLFGTGMRRSELAAIRTGDIDIVERTIRVPKSKNGRPRTAVIDPRAHRQLALWLDERTQRDPEHDLLWLNARGDALRPDGLKMVVRRVADRAGIPFSAHDARRAFAVAWLAAGGTETGLMAVCGWSSPVMVARYVRERQATLAVEEARRLFAA